MLELVKLTETTSAITLGWTPPAGVDVYAFYANGQRVSTGDDKLKDGSWRKSVRFSKTSPGPPFQVVALCRSGGSWIADWGSYPSSTPPSGVFPSTTIFPSEAMP